MSDVVADHNSDLKRLQNEGYEIEIKQGCCIIYNIPYLDSTLSIQKGIIVSPVIVTGDTIKYDNNHVAYFAGSMPYRKSGEPLSAIINSPNNTIFAGIQMNYMLSNKPVGGYKNYYEKFSNYINIIVSEAQAVDSTVTAKTFQRIVSIEEDVLEYSDTNSSRAIINHHTDKLRNQKIAIVGLGGTGSYILDQVAKTPVSEIHLYDGDVFCQHNAFRAPGAANSDIFKVQPYKSNYFKDIYSNMHKYIISHPYFLDENNVQELSEFDFVFLAVDTGEHKRVIIDELFKHHIKFIDTGIDISENSEKNLLGMTRTTIISNDDYDVVSKNICFEETNDYDLYQSNIQTADLNALCAINAVIEWKKLCGFYIDNNIKSNYVYNTNDGEFK